MTELLTEVKPEEIVKAVKKGKKSKEDAEGLIKFIRLEEQQTIPVPTKFGLLYIRKPTYADRLAMHKFKDDYAHLSEEEVEEVRSIFLLSRIIIKPRITFEELINQPTEYFIEITTQVGKHVKELALEVTDEDTKKK